MYLAEPSSTMLLRGTALLKRLVLLAKSSHLFYIKEQTPHHSIGEPSFCYIGDGTNLRYLKKTWMINKQKLTCLKIPVLRLNRILVAQAHIRHVVFVDINKSLNFLLPDNFFVSYPWIRQKIYLASPQFCQRRKAIEGTFGRKVRKNKFRQKMTKEIGALKEFYWRFYKPYIEKRFADDSHIRRYTEFRKAIKKGFLLQVFDGMEWVSGAICELHCQTVKVLGFGISGNYDFYLRKGALSAVYYFLINWALQERLTVVDLLRSRANLQDGVYEHKRRWGAVTEKDPWVSNLIGIFIPESLKVPSRLKDILVWDEHGFRSLGSLVKLELGDRLEV